MFAISRIYGFKDIYFLETNCSYGDSVNSSPFYGEDTIGEEYGIHGIYGRLNLDEIFSAYKVAIKYAENHGIKIYNATRGGHLEVFERVDFDFLF